MISSSFFKIFNFFAWIILCFTRDPAQKDGIKTSTLSEHKIVLEVIWLLLAPCDSAVFMQVISDDGLKTHFCVRPHVTASSVTQDVFSSFMRSICTYADMLKDLQDFCSKLLESCEGNKVCGTYEAYRCALLHELQNFYELLSLLERKAHIQGLFQFDLFKFSPSQVSSVVKSHYSSSLYLVCKFCFKWCYVHTKFCFQPLKSSLLFRWNFYSYDSFTRVRPMVFSCSISTHIAHISRIRLEA